MSNLRRRLEKLQGRLTDSTGLVPPLRANIAETLLVP